MFCHVVGLGNLNLNVKNILPHVNLNMGHNMVYLLKHVWIAWNKIHAMQTLF